MHYKIMKGGTHGYKVNKELTDIKNKMIYDGWENWKGEITLHQYCKILNAMPISLSHLYLLLRTIKQEEEKEK